MLGESKFFKNIEIAWARKANAIAIAYLHRITQGIMLLLDGIIHENALQTVKTDKILAARVLLVICTRVTRNYIKMHSFHVYYYSQKYNLTCQGQQQLELS